MPVKGPLVKCIQTVSLYFSFFHFRENVIENRSTESPKRPNAIEQQKSWHASNYNTYTLYMLLWLIRCSLLEEMQHMDELVRVSADIIIIINNDDEMMIIIRSHAVSLLILPNLKWKRVHRSYNKHIHIHKFKIQSYASWISCNVLPII